MRRIFVPATVAALAAAVAVPAVTRTAAAQVQHTAATKSAPALDDATIVAIFDAANAADVETGKLAAKRGSTKAVRDLGAMFARDHDAVRQQGRDLAKKLGVTPTPPKGNTSAKDQAKVMAELRAKHGADFDRAYLEHEVAFHQAVIDAVNQTLLPAIQNPDLKDLVTKVAPAFQAHMMAAQHLEEQMAK
jgi:putative membrane protein